MKTHVNYSTTDLAFVKNSLDVITKHTSRESKVVHNRYPHVTENGNWVYVDVRQSGYWDESGWHHGNWTCGFWPGVLWNIYDYTKDRRFWESAVRDIELIAVRKNDSNTHDLGFLFYPSFALGYEVTKRLEYRETALAAARTITKRFIHSGGYITSWGSLNDSRSAGTSAIDTMMNLPLLWWAYHQTNDSLFYDVARNHAETSLKVYIREDGSCYHTVRFNNQGEVIEKGTYQGLSQESCWSRGLAWAISGFSFAYRATQEKKFLDAVENTLTYYKKHVPEDLVPYWDFSDQSKNSPKDSSAAAITAYGLLVLADTLSEEKGNKYRSYAIRILRSLSSDYLNPEKSLNEGILLKSCYSKPHQEGVDGATAFGDYYYTAALTHLYKRLLQPNFFV